MEHNALVGPGIHFPSVYYITWKDICLHCAPRQRGGEKKRDRTPPSFRSVLKGKRCSWNVYPYREDTFEGLFHVSRLMLRNERCFASAGRMSSMSHIRFCPVNYCLNYYQGLYLPKFKHFPHIHSRSVVNNFRGRRTLPTVRLRLDTNNFGWKFNLKVGGESTCMRDQEKYFFRWYNFADPSIKSLNSTNSYAANKEKIYLKKSKS